MTGRRVLLLAPAYASPSDGSTLREEPEPRVTVARQSLMTVRPDRAYTYGQSNPMLRPVVPVGF